MIVKILSSPFRFCLELWSWLDGFNFNFFKSCRDLVKQEVIGFVQEFYINAPFPKAITASFLALIPKRDNLHSLSNYKPISLIGSIYNIITKILALRLKRVLGKFISTCQSSFLPNRQIMDGVLVDNEIIDLAKRRDQCLLLKVDFEKAYNSVSWKYLDYMLGWMGSNCVWRRWMKVCVTLNSVSVLVNGSPT